MTNVLLDVQHTPLKKGDFMVHTPEPHCPSSGTTKAPFHCPYRRTLITSQYRSTEQP